MKIKLLLIFFFSASSACYGGWVNDLDDNLSQLDGAGDLFHSNELVRDVGKLTIFNSLTGDSIENITGDMFKNIGDFFKKESLNYSLKEGMDDLNSNTKGSLGHNYFILGMKECRNGNMQKASNWFKEAESQGYSKKSNMILKCNNLYK